MQSVFYALAILFGIAILVWSADRFVDGAAALSRRLGMPSFLIGAVVVGFGTSAPEMTVSAFAAAGGNSGVALGNAYGSNICNIALILGACAAIRAMSIEKNAVMRDMLPLLLATILSWILFRDDALSRPEALLLLGVFALWLVFTIWRGSKQNGESSDSEASPGSSPSGAKIAFNLLVGLFLLVGSSRLLVWGAVGIAKAIGVSDLVIGLTIVAIGTSLPELASSIAATLRGEDDLAVGNVVGSNIFNTLVVVGIAGAISPMANIQKEVFARDLPATLGFTIFLLLCALPIRGKRAVRRPAGFLLLAMYVLYMATLAKAA